jgi:hypothetical protein
MYIVSITLIANEQDIVEAFVRYHSVIFDKMVIITHNSMDQTRCILNRLKFEGFHLEIINSNEIAFYQKEIINNEINRVLNSYSPDLVIPIDCDEFIISDNEISIKDKLMTLPPDKVTKIKWITYVPTIKDDIQEKNILLRICHRRVKEEPIIYKSFIPKKMLLENNLVVTQGGHSIINKDTQEVVPFEISNSLSLAHIPIRSVNQLMIKALIGWPSNLARKNKKSKEAYQWKKLFDQCKNGISPTLQEVCNFAINYASKKNVDEVEVVYDPISCPSYFSSVNYYFKDVNPILVLSNLVENFAKKVSENLPLDD